MNLADVMDEIGDQLDLIEGLRVYRYPTDAPQVPAAIVSYPVEWTFDSTMRRGTDECVLGVVVVVGKGTDRAARDRLAKYVDGSGSASVKAVVEAGEYTSLATARVAEVVIGTGTWNGVEYLSAVFEISISGRGA